MTNKEIVQDLLRRMPDDASLQDIARELEFIAAVRQGLAELDNGDSVPIEEVENELPHAVSGKLFSVSQSYISPSGPDLAYAVLV